jgi:hypothetical protein
MLGLSVAEDPKMGLLRSILSVVEGQSPGDHRDTQNIALSLRFS